MLPELIESKIARVPESGCWLWVGALRSEDYGLIRWNGVNASAHRVVYELLRGPIPQGFQLDHLCRVHCCVNPSHLEPVTPTVNKLRGTGTPAVNARKTHCQKGHLLMEPNLMPSKRGHRRCRICHNEYGKKFYHQKVARLKLVTEIRTPRK